jgi:hypothetical protein
VDAESAQPEMRHVDLEQRRRVARDLDPGRRDGHDRMRLCDKRQSAITTATDDADDHRQDRDLDRDERALKASAAGS